MATLRLCLVASETLKGHPMNDEHDHPRERSNCLSG
jgi:hypothetical protein